MTRFPRYAVVSVPSIAAGFIACRTYHEYDGRKGVPQSAVSTFEADALGFVNWYRIMGRDAIPHEELTRNLQVLESKAVASGRLIVTHKPGDEPAQQGAPGQPATRPESK